MAENETPQAITREEFEACVEFYYENEEFETYKLNEAKPGQSTRYLWSEGTLYGSIENITMLSFTLNRWFFNESISRRIFFSKCFKLPNQ